MITEKREPDSEAAVRHVLSSLVDQWFFAKYPSLSLAQRMGVLEIHSRRNVLLSAPTGSTKTLTAFLSIINELVQLKDADLLEDRIYALYVSPLKALNADIAYNLNEPLAELEAIAGPLGIRVAVRTGDTTLSERAKMARNPPHILITTPESLDIILTTQKFSDALIGVQWVIVDEIHSLAENKRGVDLSLALERLEDHSPGFSRVGLSATVAPLHEVARYLVGYHDDGSERDALIIDVHENKQLDLTVLSPVEDLIRTPMSTVHDRTISLIHELIQAHTTTLIFTNTRAATERVVNALKERYPSYESEQRIGAHHSSLSRESRHAIEDALRKGELKAVVSSTSLELGIDIGSVDLVILLSSPKSVARALQRVGRSGHRLAQTSKGRLIATSRSDLLECATIVRSAREGRIDRIHIPRNCLDVLAQHIFAVSIVKTWDETELYRLIRRSYAFRHLSIPDYNDVLTYLEGAYPGLESRMVYPKIWREGGMIGRRGRLARVLSMTNVGTIPDESFVTVKQLGSDVPLGRIDEGFLERLKKGDVFVLGGNKYVFSHAKGMVAFVSGSVQRSPTIPSWFSEMLPLSFDLARSMGFLCREVERHYTAKTPAEDIIGFIEHYLHIDRSAAAAIHTYLYEQHRFSMLPHDERILVERYEEDGYRHLLFVSLYGRRVNDVLSRAFAFIAAKTQGRDVQIGITDHGFVLTTIKPIALENTIRYLRAEKLRVLMEHAIAKSEVLSRRFRHCAARSLMILRSYKGERKSAGKQQVSSMRLLKTVREMSEDFPILREARREVLEDMMDIESATQIVEGIMSGRIRLFETNIAIPSPFAFDIALQGRSDLIKIEDRQAFLERMHNEVLAKIALNTARKRV